MDLSVGKSEMATVNGPGSYGESILLNSLSRLNGIDKGDVFFESACMKTMSDRYLGA